MKKPTKRKPKPRETSDRVSRIAAKLLRDLTEYGLEAPHTLFGCSLRDLKAICASALAQDQTKGKRK